MISSSRALRAAQAAATAQITGLFQDLSDQVTGTLTAAADSDGIIRAADSDAVRARVREVVQQYFVMRRRLTFAERDAELDRLSALIDRARQAAKSGSEASRRRAAARVRMLMERYATLDRDGVSLEAVSPAGEPLSRYARIVWGQVEAVTRAQVEMQAAQMRKALGRRR